MTTSIDTIELDSAAALKAPDVTRLTTQSIDGTGVFDVLMKATKLHLQEEYESDRITGAEYAEVYISAMSAVMQQSVTFLLNTQQEEKIQAEIALVRQQTVTELAQTDDTIPEGLGFNGDGVVEGLVASKKAIDALQANLVAEQISHSIAETELIESKLGLAPAQMALTGAQTDLAVAQISLSAAEVTLVSAKRDLTASQVNLGPAEVLLTDAKTDLVTSQLLIADADIALTDAKKDLTVAQLPSAAAEIAFTNAKTALTTTQNGVAPAQITLSEAQADLAVANTALATDEIGLAAAKITLTAAQGSLAAAQEDKIAAENKLVGQKVITELAQTCDNLALANSDMGYNDSAVVEGMMKVQKDKVTAELILVDQKVVTELSQTSDTKPVDLGQGGDTSIDGLVASQKEKVRAEVTLLGQKANTELAQTSDTVMTSGSGAGTFLNIGSAVAGIVDKQKDLYERQASGYLRDAEQKATKMMLETWSVAASMDKATREIDNSLDNTSLKTFVDKLKSGIITP